MLLGLQDGRVYYLEAYPPRRGSVREGLHRLSHVLSSCCSTYLKLIRQLITEIPNEERGNAAQTHRDDGYFEYHEIEVACPACEGYEIAGNDIPVVDDQQTKESVCLWDGYVALQAIHSCARFAHCLRLLYVHIPST